MKFNDSYAARIDRVAAAIRPQWDLRPDVGLILGTGAGQIAEHLQIDCRIPYAKLPDFPRSTSLGHRGAFVCGRLAQRPVIAMQGRFHLYEGHSLRDTKLPVHVMRQLGIRRLLVSNAAGGVNPAFHVGELMLIESQIDLFFRAADVERHPHDDLTCRPVVRADSACDERLARRAVAISRAHKFELRRGVYVGMLGPCYETQAEYRMCRTIGGDAVGMSTIPEIAAASDHGIPTLAISIITNVGGAENAIAPSGHAVLAAAESAAQHLRLIFTGLVESPSIEASTNISGVVS